MERRYTYTAVIEPDEGGFHAFVPALPGCHTFGETMEAARANLKEAAELYLECLIQDGEPVPASFDLVVTQVEVAVTS